MKQLDNGHLCSGFYETVEVDIEKVLRDISFPEGEMEEFPYGSPHDFLQGSCELFAYALKQRFGYEICEVRNSDGGNPHWFGRVKRQELIFYVDVRGMTTDYDLFLSGLAYPPKDPQPLLVVTDDVVDFHDDWTNLGIEIALRFIDEHSGYYS